LRNATTSFVMSVRLSVRPHGTTRLSLKEFSWNFLFHHFFFKSVEKIQVSSKPEKGNLYFTWRLIYIYDNKQLSFFFLKWEVIQTKVVEKIKTHFMYKNFFLSLSLSLSLSPRKSCLILDSAGKCSRVSEATDDIMATRVTCCIPKSTDPQLKFVSPFQSNNGCKNAPPC